MRQTNTDRRWRINDFISAGRPHGRQVAATVFRLFLHFFSPFIGVPPGGCPRSQHSSAAFGHNFNSYLPVVTFRLIFIVPFYYGECAFMCIFSTLICRLFPQKFFS
jgi:hypothetical protein